jgi:hypothetical protein
MNEGPFIKRDAPERGTMADKPGRFITQAEINASLAAVWTKEIAGPSCACCAPPKHDPQDPECVCDACLACDHCPTPCACPKWEDA